MMIKRNPPGWFLVRYRIFDSKKYILSLLYIVLYVNKRAILLVLDRQEKMFKQKIFLNYNLFENSGTSQKVMLQDLLFMLWGWDMVSKCA